MAIRKEKSELRERAKERATEQRVIDAYTTGRLEIINWLRNTLFSKFSRTNTPITDHHPISPWDESMRQLAEMETLLYPVPDITITKAQHIQLPITGDIIMENITQDNKSTSNHQDSKFTHIQQELVAKCQESMRNFYHTQDPKCMPHVIKMSLLRKMALEPLVGGKFFPGTGIDDIAGVLVEYDPSIGDTIICE